MPAQRHSGASTKVANPAPRQARIAPPPRRNVRIGAFAFAGCATRETLGGPDHARVRYNLMYGETGKDPIADAQGTGKARHAAGRNVGAALASRSELARYPSGTNLLVPAPQRVPADVEYIAQQSTGVPQWIDPLGGHVTPGNWGLRDAVAPFSR